MLRTWDYLIVTASNDAQARAYEGQLALRERLGLLADVRAAMVVADPQGKRIGSGGSTIYCLMQVLNKELTGDARGIGESGGHARLNDPASWQQVLERLRILIIHAGGDSKRLPAYGPCGKIFVPVPGESDSALGATLFDRLLPTFLALPEGPGGGGGEGERGGGGGQVVVASGDALLRFDPASVKLNVPGFIALGSYATPEAASKHGVFLAGGAGEARPVRKYLQKPKPAEQAAAGAVNRYGQSILDIGVMSLDAATAVKFLTSFEAQVGTDGKLEFSPAMFQVMLTKGLDIYREVCCAMGTEATAEHHINSARGAGSTWDEAELKKIFAAISSVPFYIETLAQSHFLHFGTTRQLITSGLDLMQQDAGVVQPGAVLGMNNEVSAGGSISGGSAWIEACRIKAPLQLGGWNVVVGVEVDEALVLPEGACVDVLKGRKRGGEAAYFVRCYGISDAFKDIGEKATLCGANLMKWLVAVGAKPEEIWDAGIPAEKRSLWDAKVFPAEKEAQGYQKWLWMFNAGKEGAAVSVAQKQAFLNADRYSVAEMAMLTDQDAFYERRAVIRAEEIRRGLRRMFRRESGFSAGELAYCLQHAEDPAAWAADLLAEARFYFGDAAHAGSLESFVFCRIIHSLGAALELLTLASGSEKRGVPASGVPLSSILPGLLEKLSPDVRVWLLAHGLLPQPEMSAAFWGERARRIAFTQLNDTILKSSLSQVAHPRNALRSDETIWGRAPCRLELGGGWTDTPPYTLEYGGTVANTAINLNGQPPIHVYGRVVEEPVIRLTSIDAGERVEIRELSELLNYRDPRDTFGLVKGALALAGFSPEIAQWPAGITLQKMLAEFGGGIELTTLVGIPKGSGLGTSSVIGAVLVAVIHRMMNRPLTQRELFHNVLRLEQALTTGGGWQDQIGGGVGGSKITTTRPGLLPDPSIHYFPDDLLDPSLNGGSTLLYYTGITRLAKNILEQVVGGYLNRNRRIMAALAHEHEVAHAAGEALARKDAAAFGGVINTAWRLQQQLCPDVTNPQIDSLLDRIRGRIHGARILGAGSGGFMLMICKTPADASAIRADLQAKPLNERARFFEYQINHAGLEVTTC